MDARIPAWLREAIQRDMEELGHGPRSKDGAKALVSAALIVYLELPEAERRDLARLTLLPDEGHVRRATGVHWLTQVIRAITSIGEAAALRHVEAIEKGEAQGRSDGTSEGRPSSAGRRSRGAKGAA